MIRLLFVCLFLVAWLLTASSGSAAGDPENGETVYLEHGCYSCHGYNGIGRHQLANDVSGFLVNETVFTTYLRLRAEQNPMLPANSMPNYSAEVLSDDEAADVYAYIKTLVDDPPELEDIPVFMRILDAAEEKNRQPDEE